LNELKEKWAFSIILREVFVSAHFLSLVSAVVVFYTSIEIKTSGSIRKCGWSSHSTTPRQINKSMC